MILGLTGGIGAGKTTACNALAELGLRIIDCDVIARYLTDYDAQAIYSIELAFGKSVLTAQGALDRKALATAAFASEQSRRMLETILHPKITGVVASNIKLAKYCGKSMVVSAPLLFEGGLDKLCDATMLISASEELRIARLARDRGLSEAEARSRMAAQLPDDRKRELAGCIVDNNGSLEQFKAAVVEGWKALSDSYETED